MNFGTETIGFNALRVLGLFGMFSLLFSITVLPLAVILFKVYEKFQKDKEPSSFLYILLGIIGTVWGGVGAAAFLPYRPNLLIVILPIVISLCLGYIWNLEIVSIAHRKDVYWGGKDVEKDLQNDNVGGAFNLWVSGIGAWTDCLCVK